jgi:hypothetical protein
VITHKSFHVTLSDQRERRVFYSGNFMLENGDSSVASLPQNDILGDVGSHQDIQRTTLQLQSSSAHNA